MSSPEAIATVTAALQRLLSDVVPGGTGVTTKPPSTARNESIEQLNIFLYAVHYNTAFTNAPMIGETRQGEKAYPPLPLVLKYLITAYGDGDEDISGQQVMGRAMSLLHDHPLLGAEDINGILPESNLQQQIERVRITPDPLSLDDISKLWTSFQSAEYRLSTGYQVSVVLIESSRESRAALPVIKRGSSDQGAHVLAEDSPSITGLRFPNLKPSVELGDSLIILGEHLDAENITVLFEHPQLEIANEIVVENNHNVSELELQIPGVAEDPEVGSKWPAGFYQLSLKTEKPNLPSWTSNSVAMPLSPVIETIVPLDAVIDVAGNIELTVECLPQISNQQTVTLLFSDRMITADSIVTAADATARTVLQFTIDHAVARTTPYVARLRVDGVDSIPIDFSSDSPQFSDNQKVTVS